MLRRSCKVAFIVPREVSRLRDRRRSYFRPDRETFPVFKIEK